MAETLLLDESAYPGQYAYQHRVWLVSQSLAFNTSTIRQRTDVIHQSGPAAFGDAPGFDWGASASWSGGSDNASGSSGAFNFGSTPSILMFERTFTIPHATDGSRSFVSGFSKAYWTAGFPAYGNSWSVSLPTLRGTPSVPTGVTATRVSDTSVTVAWSQSSPGNSQPTQNSVQRRVNGGSWTDVVTISAASSVVIGAAANQKLEYRVRASNAAGVSDWSAASSPLYTTPAAPSSVVAAKDASLDIDVSWTPNVAFTEHEHVVEHGTVTGGVTTWDGSPLASVASGTSTYKHSSPDAGDVHVYRVSAKNTDTAALSSSAVASSTVQLLVAPDKPTVAGLPTYADKGRDFIFPWTHNPVDTTAQTAYEVEYSTNGGSSWTSTTKVTSGTSSYTVAADTYTSGQALTTRVRTWGQATTGGSDGTGASPWSDPATVTFKTRPVATVVSPADSSTWTEASLSVMPGFSQAESASFVQATIVLSDSGGDIESRVTNALSAVTFDTRVEDAGSYTVTVTVLDSHGITSDPATSDFSVAYTLPVEAGVTVTYLREEGVAQIDLTFPTPGVGEAAAVAVTVSRSIDGVREDILTAYPITGALTVLDSTPTIQGTNEYRVRTISADGATADVTVDLPVAEPYWAFLSTGPGFTRTVSFFGNLAFDASPSRSTALARASGRRRPIALFGAARGLVVSGSADLFPGMGSTPQEVEAFILDAGIVCYRDPSGRRMFGTVTGALSSPSSLTSTFTFTVTEAS